MMTRSSALSCAVALSVLVSALAVPAAEARTRRGEGGQFRPGERQYALVQGHNPIEFERAVNTGADMLRDGSVKQFAVYVVGKGIFLTIPGLSIVQKSVLAAKRRAPGLKIVVCREVVDAVTKLAKRRPPLIPGTTVETCNNRSKELEKAGWQRAVGV